MKWFGDWLLVAVNSRTFVIVEDVFQIFGQWNKMNYGYDERINTSLDRF
jgi:hypothetical protein